MPRFEVRRTWTYSVEIEAADEKSALNDPTLEDRFMEAYTQGDGESVDAVFVEPDPSEPGVPGNDDDRYHP